MTRLIAWCICCLATLATAAERSETGLVTYVYKKSTENFVHQFIYYTGKEYKRCWCGEDQKIEPGDCVSLVGNDDREWSKGLFFNAHSLTICGHQNPPAPINVTGRELADDKYLYQVVIAEGTVTDVLADDIDDRVILFQLTDGKVCFYASAYLDASHLSNLRRDFLGADVSLCGVCEPHCGERFFGNRFIHLSHGNLPSIIHRRLDSPRASPPLCISQHMPPSVLCDDRYHSVSGCVLAVFDEGRRFLLQESDRYQYALEGQMDNCQLSRGENVIISGVPSTDLFSVRLRNCQVERLGKNPQYVEPEPQLIRAEDLMKYSDSKRAVRCFMRFNGHLVSLEGVVLAMPRADIGEQRMMLDLDGHHISVDLSCIDVSHINLRKGDTISVVGRFLVDSDDWTASRPIPHIHGIVIVPRNAEDISIVHVALNRYITHLLVCLGVLIMIIVSLLFRGRTLKLRTRVKTEERTRLAVELHDSLSQNLSGIALQLGATRTALESGREAALNRLDTAENMIDSCRRELKCCLYDLRHHAIDEANLNQAVKMVVSTIIGETALSVRIEVPRSALDDTAAQAVLSILRELAANSIRHGHARQIAIAGSVAEDGALMFSVQDDGVGFDVSTAPGVNEGHFGLNGVKERLERLKGRLWIESTSGRGTYIRFMLPSTLKKVDS